MIRRTYDVAVPVSPIVNTVRSLDPELDRARPQSQSTPVRRARDVRHIAVGKRCGAVCKRQPELAATLTNLPHQRVLGGEADDVLLGGPAPAVLAEEGGPGSWEYRLPFPNLVVSQTDQWQELIPDAYLDLFLQL